MVTDLDARRLAGSSVQRYVEDVGVGGALFHLSDDFRQLRSVQPARCHPRRRLRC